MWQERDWLDEDDTEDEMIAKIREWRKSKHEQRASPKLTSEEADTPLLT